MTTAQLKEWRKAVAELHAEQRRNRGRRNTDPWRNALPASVKQPPVPPTTRRWDRGR